MLAYFARLLLTVCVSAYNCALLADLTGDLDSCLTALLRVFVDDIFGFVAEEKEAEDMTRKLMEMKSQVSYDSFQLVSQFVSPEMLYVITRECGRVWVNVGECGRVWESVGKCGRVWESVLWSFFRDVH